MKQSVYRLFCLLLCAVMVVGMIPAAASAAQNEPETFEEETLEGYQVTHAEDGTVHYTPTTVTRQKAVPAPVQESKTLGFSAQKAIEQEDWGDYTFETFEELKELCAQTYDEHTNFTYVGGGTLIISENLTLPSYTSLNFWSDKYSLVVSKGKTLTISDMAFLNCDNLKVNGTVISNDTVTVYKNLTVSGSLTAWIIEINPDTVVTGAENITSRDYRYKFRINYAVDTLTEAKKAIAKAAADPATHYSIDFDLQKDLSISSSITVPENVYLWIGGGSLRTFTVGSGATLKAEGTLEITVNLVINGKLVSNGHIGYCGSRLAFGSTGSYSGKGRLTVQQYNDEFDTFDKIVTGLDTTNLEITKMDEGWGPYWVVRDLSSLTRLSAPTGLTWNKANVWDGDAQEYKEITRYGSIRFTPGKVRNDTGFHIFRVVLYKDGKEVYSNFYYFSDYELEEYTYGYASLFASYDFGSGEYYFTVQSLADGIDFLDSTVAKSKTWTYEKPSSKMAKPTGLKWNSLIGTWTPYTEEHTAHAVKVYYAPTADAKPQHIDTLYGEYLTDFSVSDWLLQNYGYGYYSFRVRTLSTSINKKVASDWTSLSSKYHYTADSKPATPTLYVYTFETGKPYLEWRCSPGSMKYQIYRATSKSGTYSHLKTVTFQDFPGYGHYIDDSAALGKTYYYKVRAISPTDVKSSFSSVVSGKSMLAWPQNVTISNDASTGKPVVKWGAVPNAAEYEVWRATTKGGTFSKVKTTTSRSYTDTKATAGKVYYYTIVAVYEKTAYNSHGSEIVSARCDLKRPVVTISLSSAGNPYLKWSEISGAEKYFIYRSTSKTGSYTRIGSTTDLKYIDKDVTEGTTYYYKVKAIHSNTNANSAYSAIDTITAK